MGLPNEATETEELLTTEMELTAVEIWRECEFGESERLE